MNNLTFPLSNMVPVSSSNQSSNTGDTHPGFEIYFQEPGVRGNSPASAGNNSAAVSANQSLDFTTPDIRSAPGTNAETTNLVSQRTNTRLSSISDPARNSPNFWIRTENSNQLQPNPVIFPPLTAQTAVPFFCSSQWSKEFSGQQKFFKIKCANGA